ncbi:hypothetical protein TNCV_3819481 [Trichonephila clavipes]|nr:hypothetical protein TNCV_3819481 [Trichonephila clavipes]
MGRIDRQNSRFRTAKTTIIKFGLHASFVELESAKSALNEIREGRPTIHTSPAIFIMHSGFVRKRARIRSTHQQTRNTDISVKFVLVRDLINFEESISVALIEEQNVKLNQIANDERTGLSPSQTETSVISALTNKLQEINLRVERLQEASSVTARKTGGDLFRRRETVFKCFYCGFQGHRQAECRKKKRDERRANYQPPGETPRANFLFSVTQALILSIGDMSISKNRLFAIITQPPGIRRTGHKLGIEVVSDAILETTI